MHTNFETDGAIATLTFNRPEARNAMTWEMYESLVAACEQSERRRERGEQLGNLHLWHLVARGANHSSSGAARATRCCP